MSEKLLINSSPAKGVLQIQLNRPKVLNALNTQVLIDLAEQLEQAKDNSQVRVVIITGNDRAFAAGADIEELKLAAEGKFPEEERQRAWKALRQFPKPIIAAVSGFALGGGCELMMVADIVIASRKSKFGQPEINLGIIPGAGGTQRLTKLIGKTAAMKLNLTGELISAEEALRLGIITEIAEPEIYLKRSIELATSISEKSSVAAAAIKASVLNAYESHLEQGLKDERSEFLTCVTGEDAKEGIDAFINKRKPNFPSNT